MTKPQRPDVARSGRSLVNETSAEAKATSTPPSVTEGTGPVPEENRPGHHPYHDQDKPAGPPPRPDLEVRFEFRFEGRVGRAARLCGASPSSAGVYVNGDDLVIRYGPWTLATTLDNVEGATETGPYHWWKVAGPPRLSLADRGVTFATTAAGGLCIRFVDPVPAALPMGMLRHPAATVTVVDVDGLRRLLEREGSAPSSS